MDTSNVFLLGPGQFSYPYLHEIDPDPEYGGSKHTSLLVSKDDWLEGESYDDLRTAVMNLAKQKIKVKVKGKLVTPTKLSQFKTPFKDGDKIAEEKDPAIYSGKVEVRAKSQYPFAIIDAQKNKLSDEEVEAKIKGGDWGRVWVSPYYYPHNGGGIGLGIKMIQYWKPCKAEEAFGGDPDAMIDTLATELDVDMEDVEEEEVEAAPKKRKAKKKAAPVEEEDYEEEEEEVVAKPKKKAKRSTKKKKAAPVVEEVDYDDEEDDDYDDDGGLDVDL